MTLGPLWRRILRPSEQSIQREVDDELRFHFDMRIAELVKAGVAPDAARAEAVRRFGDPDATRRAMIETDRRRERQIRRRDWLAETLEDAVFGWRQLAGAPGFTVTAILTLGVGIGAAAAIFSAADHVLLRSLPYRDPESVVTLWESDRSQGGKVREVSPANYLEWQARSRSFQSLGLAEPSGFDYTGSGTPQALTAWRVTANFLSALGAVPMLGRVFDSADYRSASPDVVLLSHSFWIGRFGADSAIVGRLLRLDDTPMQVIGVLPPGLDWPEPVDVWAPKVFRPDELTDYTSAYMNAAARLQPGITLAQAQADVDGIAAAAAAERPGTNRNAGIALVPLDRQIRGAMRGPAMVLLGAVGFLVLIACTNVSVLLLARGTRREQEMGVRAALGAGRARLIRQVLVESLVLGVVGGAVGIAMAWLGTRALGLVVPPELGRLGPIGINLRVLGFAGAMTLGSALFFGLAPALRLSQVDVSRHLAAGGRTSTGARARSSIRQALITIEVALALMLLVGAGLLGRSFLALTSNDLGFAADHRVALQVFLWDRNQTAAQRLLRVEDLSARFNALPQVKEVGVVSALPFHPHQITAGSSLVIARRAAPASGAWPRVYTTVASAGYFGLMGIPVRRGRGFAETDRDGAPAVALINETLARRFFPDEDPVGRRVTVGVLGPPASREIVGVVADVRPTGFESDPRAELFIPYAQSRDGSVTFVARTDGDPVALIGAMQAQVWQADAAQTVYHVATLPSLISQTLSTRKFHLVLMAVFASIALLLSAIGIHGLISYTTAERSREISVRVALGADRAGVIGLIVRQGLAITVPGILAGLAGALVLTRFLGAMLYGVRPEDPATLAVVAALLLVVAVAAAYLPARRAASLDPASVLREG